MSCFVKITNNWLRKLSRYVNLIYSECLFCFSFWCGCSRLIFEDVDLCCFWSGCECATCACLNGAMFASVGLSVSNLKEDVVYDCIVVYSVGQFSTEIGRMFLCGPPALCLYTLVSFEFYTCIKTVILIFVKCKTKELPGWTEWSHQINFASVISYVRKKPLFTIFFVSLSLNF